MPSIPTTRAARCSSTARTKVLVNACDESVTYPLDGEGLRQYPTSVEDGRIYVDVNELTTSTTEG